MEEEGYEEYFASTMKILFIEQNLSNAEVKKGELIEVSRINSPNNIFLESGELIWKNT